jgi:hypothetical protein
MRIKVNFVDMWGYGDYQFNKLDNYFYDLLSYIGYKVEISENPDIIFYSAFGEKNKLYDCKKVFILGENCGSFFRNPYEEEADLVLSHFETAKKNIYFPLWILFINWFGRNQLRPLPSNPTYLINLDDLDKKPIVKDKFCIFINNNPIPNRLHFFKLLSKYKKVDSFGKLENNMGYILGGSEFDKIQLLSEYTFTIAFENSYHFGYNTEKIIQPLATSCTPIYWGGNKSREIFPESRVVFADSFVTLEDLADFVISKYEANECFESRNENMIESIRDYSPDYLIKFFKSYLNV